MIYAEKLRTMSVDELANFIYSIQQNVENNTVCLMGTTVVDDITTIKAWLNSTYDVCNPWMQSTNNNMNLRRVQALIDLEDIKDINKVAAKHNVSVDTIYKWRLGFLSDRDLNAEIRAQIVSDLYTRDMHEVSVKYKVDILVLRNYKKECDSFVEGFYKKCNYANGKITIESAYNAYAMQIYKRIFSMCKKYTLGCVAKMLHVNAGVLLIFNTKGLEYNNNAYIINHELDTAIAEYAKVYGNYAAAVEFFVSTNKVQRCVSKSYTLEK